MNTPTFSLFEQLLPQIPELVGAVPDLANYLGHLPPQGAADDAPKEPLTEHIDRVNTNALRLMQAHGLELVVEQLVAAVCAQTGIRLAVFGSWLKELFLGAIAFHDYGKLNENFQRERMRQLQFPAVVNGIKHHHAGLGAYLFFHHYFLQVRALQPLQAEANSVMGLLLDFADLIALHHSPRLHESQWNEATALLRRYLVLPTLQQAPDLSTMLEAKAKQTIRGAVFPGGIQADGFARFALLKLGFSLLTASDYLATLGYMQTGGDYTRLDAATLGVLSAADKAAFRARFRSFKYNQNALADPDQYADLAWEQVRERSNENLDALRQKLLAEVVRAVRQRPDQPLYYLEAPTGAGKTNLSLAVALELLNHDARLGKVFYVFPFTTLITQTYDDIKEKLGLTEAQIVQLHSKAEYETATDADGAEGSYGPNWHNHVDKLFVQYPITLLSHVRFFDVLKGNGKEANYLLHRLANSVVVLDEVQSYNPKLWDHVNYFLLHYARLFNIRVVVMSATLPRLHQLTRENVAPPVVALVCEAKKYFQNPNFAGRVQFDFELTGNDWRKRYTQNRNDEDQQREVLNELATAVAVRCEAFAATNDKQAAAVIEFITKKSAAGFVAVARQHPQLADYEIWVLSGTILEPRRREVVRWLKDEATRRRYPRLLLVCTQVVEAGVDIDMDLGFKDRSLLDSDEQLAGRVNRNARRPPAPVYLFDLDSEVGIYGPDLRLKVASDLATGEYERILREKDFGCLYDQVIAKLNKLEGKITDTFGYYLQLVRLLDYADIDRKFQLIENDTESVFIPWDLPAQAPVFSAGELRLLEKSGKYWAGDATVSGKQVFALYVATIQNKTGDFIRDREARQRLQSIMSKFTISVYPQLAEQMRRVATPEQRWHEYGFVYLHEPSRYYSYEEGLLPNVNFAVGDIW